MSNPITPERNVNPDMNYQSLCSIQIKNRKKSVIVWFNPGAGIRYLQKAGGIINFYKRIFIFLIELISENILPAFLCNLIFTP